MKCLLLTCFLFAFTTVGVAQPVYDPMATGSEVGGTHLLRLQPHVGEVFHYSISTKSVASIKNDDNLLNQLMPNLRKIDKANSSITYYITKVVRGIWADSAVDFLAHIDSIHYTLDDNGSVHSFTSTRPADCKDSLFTWISNFAGRSIGVISSARGIIQDIYGYYPMVDEAFANLADSMQTGESRNSIGSDLYSAFEKLFNHALPYLSPLLVAKDSTSSDLYDEDYAVWSSITFPVQRSVERKVNRYEKRGDKTYAVIDADISISPTERVLEEEEYHTTLPSFSFGFKDTQVVDVATGMLAYDRSTEDISYGMKIESKNTENEGKSFVTVSHKKTETTVQLLK